MLEPNETIKNRCGGTSPHVSCIPQLVAAMGIVGCDETWRTGATGGRKGSEADLKKTALTRCRSIQPPVCPGRRCGSRRCNVHRRRLHAALCYWAAWSATFAFPGLRAVFKLCLDITKAPGSEPADNNSSRRTTTSERGLLACTTPEWSRCQLANFENSCDMASFKGHFLYFGLRMS